MKEFSYIYGTILNRNNKKLSRENQKGMTSPHGSLKSHIKIKELLLCCWVKEFEDSTYSAL